MNPQHAMIAHDKALVSVLIIAHDTNRAKHLLKHKLKALVTVPEAMNPVALAVLCRVFQHLLAVPATNTVLAQETPRNADLQALRVKDPVTSITNQHMAFLPQPVADPTNLALQAVPREPVDQAELQRRVSTPCMESPCALLACKQVVRLVYFKTPFEALGKVTLDKIIVS